ncbi:16S rRNA (adenine(1518)-N(6)/adenine(1519)-N(6))-dimethyltransferase RsmA [Guyparkeria sp. 1SP6A2]|nr:16S rRNA (adenine(1518)-N(6)/adenine(1519)-N(6))-dimethyltransferase RsmA [Guyparkeria sp. 1SP6A2]
MSRHKTAKGVQDGHRARKRFGQNFLVDPGVIDRILSAIPEQEPVVEIGPGLGALTLPLARRNGRLVAIELDRDVIRHLQVKMDAEGLGRQVRLIPQDALRLDIEALAEAEQLERPLTVVGNLPYNIATALIGRLLEQGESIEQMVFMVQKEVAKRLAAVPNDSAYGRLSVLTTMRAEVEHLFDVPPAAFNPPPKVDSSVIRIIPRAEPLVPPAEQAGFERLVTAAFAQRRKTLRNNLKPLMSTSTIEAAGIDPSLRAQALDIPAFLTLARQLGPAD